MLSTTTTNYIQFRIQRQFTEVITTQLEVKLKKVTNVDRLLITGTEPKCKRRLPRLCPLSFLAWARRLPIVTDTSSSLSWVQVLMLELELLLTWSCCSDMTCYLQMNIDKILDLQWASKTESYCKKQGTSIETQQETADKKFQNNLLQPTR